MIRSRLMLGVAVGVAAAFLPGPVAGQAAGPAGECIVSSGLLGGARNTAPGGDNGNVPALNLTSVGAVSTPDGGFIIRLHLADLTTTPPSNGDYMTWAFHWYVTTDVTNTLYGWASVPSADPTAPPGTVDYEIGAYDSSSDTYNLITSTTGDFVQGPDGHIDIQVPRGSTSASGGTPHPAPDDVLAGLYANSYLGQNPANLSNPGGGRTQLDRAPKANGTYGGTYTVGSSCSGDSGVPRTTWTQVTGSLTMRYDTASAYDPVHKLTLLFGGWPENRPASGLLADTWTFDGTSWNRRFPLHAPPARRATAMAYDADIGEVVLFGGFDDSENRLADTWAWTGSDWTQLHPTTSPPPRASGTMAFDPQRHRLVLFGGTQSNSGADLGDTWTFNQGTWTDVTPAVSPAGRYQAGMTYDDSAQAVVLFGGYSAASSTTLHDTWTWDGASWTLRDANPPISARAGMEMAYDPDIARVVLFGGTFNLPETWTWDHTAGWVNLNVTTHPDNHYLGAMSYDSDRHRLYLVGGRISGSSNTGANNNPDYRAFGFDGSNWSQVPPTAPAPRYKPSMVFDPSIQRYVLFGGYGLIDGYLNDTWSFDGNAWTRIVTAHSPPGRYQAQMAFDGTSGNLVLFGGCCGSPKNDTWLFNGADWTQASPATPPPGRGDGSMVWDPATGRVLLFGGVGSSLLDDTWTWGGGQWTQLSPAHAPSPRDRAAMAFDVASGKMTLFSGFGGLSCQRINNIDYCTSQVPDTWTWDGVDWTQVATAVAPQARELGSMAYDSNVGGLVLYGGFFGGVALQDTWLWRGSTWQQLAPLNSPDPAYGHVLGESALGGGVISVGGLYDAAVWRLSSSPAPEIPEFPLVPATPALGAAVVGALGALRRRARR